MPVFTVVIHSSEEREFRVEAPSLEHVRDMYLKDENLLGEPTNSRVFSSEMRVITETGSERYEAIYENKIDDLLHLLDPSGEPACGEKGEWEASEDLTEVTCVLCKQEAAKQELVEKQDGGTA